MSTPDWNEVVIQIKANRWQQGSLLPSELAHRVAKDHGPEFVDILNALEHGGILTLASHTCDVQNMGVNEPFVEVILGVQVTGTSENQKTIRFIDLPVNERKLEKTYRFQDQTRFRFSRKQLAEFAPDKERFISSEYSRRLARFLAKRYDRPAFPDGFEEAIRTACQGKDKRALTLPELLKAQPDLFTGIFFEVAPDGEIGETEQYSLKITGTMRSRRFASEEEVASVRF